MPTDFPGSVDSFVNPTASDGLNSVTVPHSEQHANVNDAIIAIETYVLTQNNQFALLAGKAGGQTLHGGTAAGDKLGLASTSNVVKGGVELQSGEWLSLPEISAPSNPQSGYGRIYFKTDGKLYYKNDAGQEVELSGGGSLPLIENLETAELDNSLVLAPDGVGGVEWVAGGGGGGGGGDVTWSGIQASQLVNEFRNFPSIEGADNVRPQWWQAGTNATLTEVDLAGEGITEKYERALKIVTTANGAFAAQLFTYSAEPRLKSGRVVSMICDIWTVSGISARARLQSSVGSLGVSSDTTAAVWTRCLVEGVTLDGTTVEFRLEVDTGTAYVVPLGLHIGNHAFPLKTRGLRYRDISPTSFTVNLLGNSGSDTWTDNDVTVHAGPLATAVELSGMISQWSGGVAFYLYSRPKWDTTSPTDFSRIRAAVYDNLSEMNAFSWRQVVDENGVWQWALDCSGTDTLDAGGIYINGVWEWE